MLVKVCAVACFLGALAAADEGVEKTIRDLYTSSQAAIREARTPDDLQRVFATLAPEWVGHMPAGETITLDFLQKEGRRS